jgi:hypothetical protein
MEYLGKVARARGSDQCAPTICPESPAVKQIPTDFVSTLDSVLSVPSALCVLCVKSFFSCFFLLAVPLPFA